MKKCGFFRLCRGQNGLETRYTDGFSEIFKDNNGNKIECCFHRHEDEHHIKTWSVTEKSSGFLICQGLPTRKEAAEEVNKKYINRIFSKLQEKQYDRYRELISKAYNNAKEVTV